MCGKLWSHWCKVIVSKQPWGTSELDLFHRTFRITVLSMLHKEMHSFFRKAHLHCNTHRHVHRSDPTMAYFKPSHKNPNRNSKAYSLLFFVTIYLIFSLVLLSHFLTISPLLFSSIYLCNSPLHTHTQRFALSFSLSSDCHGVMQSFN